MIHTILSADAWFENWMLSLRTPFFLQAFNGVTWFGNTATVIGIAALIGIFCLYHTPYRRYLAGFVVTLGGAAATAYALKEIIGRARPGGLIPSAVESSFSFPSGHATLGVALYGFIAFILCRRYPERAKAIIVTAAIVILAIGFSRLYLGLHFPTDVIGGYLVGVLWLFFGIEITKRLQKD